MPIAGAPRTASVRMQSATCSTVSHRIHRSSAGSARWSRIASAPSSNRNGSTVVCGAALTPSKLLRGVLGQAEAGEDLPPLGQVPVPEGRPGGARPRRPRPAAQDPVAAAEEDLRILPVGPRAETGVVAEVTRGPLPAVAGHAQ